MAKRSYQDFENSVFCSFQGESNFDYEGDPVHGPKFKEIIRRDWENNVDFIECLDHMAEYRNTIPAEDFEKYELNDDYEGIEDGHYREW